MNMPAAFILGAMALLLLSGVHQGGLLHTIVVALGVLVLLVVVAAGAALVHPELWSPFVAPGPPVPRGLPARTGAAGVATGAALLVIAFAGFERIWAVPRASRCTGRDAPLAALAAISACAVLYALATLVMTGLPGASRLDTPAPVTAVLAATPGLGWLHQPLNLALTIVLGSGVLGLLQAQGRLLQVMARDGLLPSAFTRTHPHTRALTIATALPALLAAVAAALLPPWTLVALASAPVLLVLGLACGGVILLRLRDPSLPRAFWAPVWWLTAPTGLLSCIFLAFSLGRPTLLRLGLWLLVGLLLYFVYGYWRSQHHPQRAPEQDEA
jgi:APA family basic amino acid/polyamine antiporter